MALTSAGEERTGRGSRARRWAKSCSAPALHAEAGRGERVRPRGAQAPTRDHAVDVDDAAKVGLVEGLGELRWGGCRGRAAEAAGV